MSGVTTSIHQMAQLRAFQGEPSPKETRRSIAVGQDAVTADVTTRRFESQIRRRLRKSARNHIPHLISQLFWKLSVLATIKLHLKRRENNSKHIIILVIVSLHNTYQAVKRKDSNMPTTAQTNAFISTVIRPNRLGSRAGKSRAAFTHSPHFHPTPPPPQHDPFKQNELTCSQISARCPEADARNRSTIYNGGGAQSLPRLITQSGSPGRLAP